MKTMSEKIKNGGQAFPRACGQCGSDVEGMSLRSWFAGMAIAGHTNTFTFQNVDKEYFAKQAFALADAMIKESEKGK